MIIHADARHIPLRDGCVQCVVTSPPYFNLRNYGIAKQIGLESSPDEYVATLVGVFREVWRVLADDGVLWLNLGDSYVSVGAGNQGDGGEMATRRVAQVRDRKAIHGTVERPPSVLGVAPKNLIGVPWRVAFALQADGWYLRSDIIWSKPNPMPESVTDRPTKSHEYLFLLAKRERYYYDAAAIAEPVSVAMLSEVEQGYEGLGLKDYESAGVQNPSSVKARIIANAQKKQDALGKRTYTGFNARWDAKEAARKSDASNNGRNQQATNSEAERRDEFGTFNNNPHLRPNLTRNRRSVWEIATMPYSGAHFATMPEQLVKPCILAGSRLGDLVFDPFIGSGTVGCVAERLGRRWVGCDLNPAYHRLAKKRTAQRGLRFDLRETTDARISTDDVRGSKVEGRVTG